MGEIQAGAVVVTRFCRAGTAVFGNYINYIDRSEAKRQEMLSSYNLYNDYMDNPEKTTGLFTDSHNTLSDSQKADLKNDFKIAQENGSLMWQTVISFDNRWLEKYGIYDAKNKTIDETKLKELARGGINRMLAKENLENALWSGAIHYNTDNVHIHVATVEMDPMRQKKSYIQYEDVVVGGKKTKVPKRDEQGNIIRADEYVGRFKMKSIEACKQYIVNEIINQKDQNLLINRIIREQIVKQKKQMSIAADPELRDMFLALHAAMPKSGNRGLWNYNNSAMAFLRDQIDALSLAYIKKYHQDDYNELQQLLLQQSNVYNEAYGNSGRDYVNGKIEDLYARLGNAILKEIKDYDKNTVSNEAKATQIPQTKGGTTEADVDRAIDQEIEILMPDDILFDANYDWSKDYKQAKSLLYKRQYAEAITLFQKEAALGNVLAIYDLGVIYEYGKGVKINLEVAEQYYQKAFSGFNQIFQQGDSGSKTKYNPGYIEYRIAKCYDRGKGTEQNYEQARLWYEYAAEDKCDIANYSLGNIYYYGNGVEQSFERAEQYYLASVEKRSNGFAYYNLGQIYQKGVQDIPEISKSNDCYKRAYEAFVEMEKDDGGDENMAYRLGIMELNGIGTEINTEKAQEHFEISAELGHNSAKYQLAKLYLEQGDSEQIQKAIQLLEESAIDGKNDMAAYGLGKIYLDHDNDLYDLDQAIQWLQMADEMNNLYATYQLGKIYIDESLPQYDMQTAISYFTKAADAGNEYAQYKLGKIYLMPEFLDYKQAETWFLKAADQGNEYAQYQLAQLYLDKDHELYDLQKGMKYLTFVAMKGNEYAQYQLANLYLDESVRDVKAAEMWFLKAAEQGNDFAKYQLAQLYLNPDEEVFDGQKGIAYLTDLADTGNEYAQISLGLIYYKGEIVPKNLHLCREWMAKAADQDNEFAKQFLERLDHGYTPQQMHHYLNRRSGKQNAFALNKALNTIKKSLNNEMEQWRARREHEKIEQRERGEDQQMYNQMEYEDD